MDFRTRIAEIFAAQNCALCGETSANAICKRCEDGFKIRKNRCQLCALTLADDAKICGQCLQRPPYFSKTDTLYDYRGAVAHLIRQFKYRGRLALGAFFAAKIAQKLNALRQEFSYDAIIPMPSYPSRIREHGYHPLLELLRLAAKNQHHRVEISTAVRVKKTRPFAGLSKLKRTAEIKDAFKIIGDINYPKILLFDDIMTSTTSMNALAKTIIKNARHPIVIHAFVLARAPIIDDSKSA